MSSKIGFHLVSLSLYSSLNFLVLLQNSSMNGNFSKLQKLFASCLSLQTNSTSIKRIFELLGGYLTIGTLGPSSIAPLVAKIYELGPNPLVDIYYDLSYGRRPHVLLIISGPSTSSIILEVYTGFFYVINSRLPNSAYDIKIVISFEE